MAHPFSPILNEDEYTRAIVYIAQQAKKLAVKVLAKELLIDTVTIFAQSPEEYEFVSEYLKSQGDISKYSHGKTLYINTDHLVDNNPVKLLGVRSPDTTRPQIGYADFPVRKYAFLKAENSNNPNVKEIRSGNGIKLLELKHFEFDVLGYVVAAERSIDKK